MPNQGLLGTSRSLVFAAALLALRLGFKPGDVIRGVNRQRRRSVADSERRGTA